MSASVKQPDAGRPPGHYLYVMPVPSLTSARAFVDAHAHQVPSALIERVRATLSAAATEQLLVADTLLNSSTTLLGAVLADPAAGREVALNSLAADACVTWAFEAAADAPGSLPAQAELAMQRIADVAL